MDITSYLLGKKSSGGGGGTNLQTKDVTIIENGTTRIKPDTGYDGMSEVDVTVSGILDTSDANATASDIALGKSGYVNGVKVNGNVPVGSPVLTTNYASSDVSTYLDNLKVDTTQENTNQFFKIGDKISVLTPLSDIAPVIGATPEKIKKDDVICGVTGTYEGSSGLVIKEKDVNFYDYDGTIVYSYTKDEFSQLETMPNNPTHDGLISQGWNWSLADAKNYVSKYGFVNIGQLYKPSDNKTHIFITLDDINKTPYIGFAVNGTATIEWGDGTSDNVTSNSTSTVVYTQHIYSTSGNYEIKIFSDTNIYMSGNASVNFSYLLTDSATPTVSNVYADRIKKIYLGSNVYINPNSFSRLIKLKYITIPKDIIGGNMNSAFVYCYSLIHLNIEIKSGLSGNNSVFNYCSNLENVSFGSLASFSTNMFSNCTRLNKLTLFETAATFISNSFADNSGIKKIVISDNILTIQSNLFQGCTRLEEIIFPKELTTISNAYSMFESCRLLNKLDFSRCTSIPTTSALTLTSLPPSYKIVVPDSLYNDWIIANNWSTYATHIVKASEYIG